MSKQWGGIFPTSNRRNIAAPFQPQKRTNSGRGLTLPEIISNYTVDFRTHEFTPLCPFEDLRYEDVSPILITCLSRENSKQILFVV